MKGLIVISFLLISLNCDAQVNDSIVIRLTNNDIEQIKKSKDTIKKQCINIDTIITKLKDFNASQQELIYRLRERKAQQIAEVK